MLSEHCSFKIAELLKKVTIKGGIDLDNEQQIMIISTIARHINKT